LAVDLPRLLVPLDARFWMRLEQRGGASEQPFGSAELAGAVVISA
jgi:hypothetical protein